MIKEPNPKLKPALVQQKNSGILELLPVTVNKEYADKWNLRQTDFVCLILNGLLHRENLYRFGGMNRPMIGITRYFQILKYQEAQFSEKTMRIARAKNPNHLEGVWCIMDQYGNEKVVFEPFKSPYLINDSCIYTLNNEYYNIETGEMYCKAHNSMESNDFLFLDNNYDTDLSRRGVLKINKRDGSSELLR